MIHLLLHQPIELLIKQLLISLSIHLRWLDSLLLLASRYLFSVASEAVFSSLLDLGQFAILLLFWRVFRAWRVLRASFVA